MKLYKLRKAVITPLLALSLLGLSPLAAVADTADPSNTTTIPVETTTESPSDLDIIEEVLYYLEAYNIEGVEREQFIENAVRGMVYSLDDPYSDYYTESDLEAFEDDLNQEYVGIGVTMRFHGGKLYITDVIANSPAQKAGIRQGDIITKIDGHSIKTEEDVWMIQGEENSRALVTVNRSGKDQTLSVTRASFEIPAISAKYVPSSRVGYIAISSFTDTVDQDFATELSNLRSQGMGALVLDLRDNLGGYVEPSLKIAEQFMEEGVLMYTADQSGEYEAVVAEGGSKIGMPVVILTNEMTASASEILTAALHDNGVAKVVGTPTFGKARIQNLFPLSNGSSLKLTVQSYLTPNKVDFNHIGLVPDIEVSNQAAQLITGLTQAGVRNIELSAGPSSFKVNGLSFGGSYIDVIKKGNKVYAPSRVLAALTKQEVSWNKSTNKLILSDGKGHLTGFTLSSGNVTFQDNESFIELHEFQKKFRGLKWNYDKGNISLKYTASNSGK